MSETASTSSKRVPWYTCISAALCPPEKPADTEERSGELAGRVEYGMFWRPPDEELELLADAPSDGGGAKPLVKASFAWLFFAVKV